MTTLRRGLAGAALLIAAVTVLSRMAGFARTVVFARTVGFDCVGALYQTTNTVPNIVFEVVAGGALATLVVPLLAGHLARGASVEAGRTASALLTWALTLLVPAGLLVAALARPIVGALVGSPPASCPRAQMVDVGARLVAVFAVQIPLYGVGLVLAGLGQARHRFLAPAVAPLLSSLVVISVYLAYAATGRAGSLTELSRGSELLLAVGTTAGVGALTLSLVVTLRGSGLRLRPTWRFPAGLGRRARLLAAAGAATLAAQQLSVAVALRLANDRGPEGAAALLALATTVFLLPWAVLAVPVATSAFPRVAAASDAGDTREWARVTAAGSRAVIVLTVAAAGVLVVCAAPVARLLASGAPGRADVTALGYAVAAFAPGLLGYGLVAHLGRALVARGDVAGSAGAVCAGWVAVAVADVAGVLTVDGRWVVVALAAGNSIGMSVAAALLLRRLRGEVALAAAPVPAALGAALLAAAAGLALRSVWGRGSGLQAVVLGLVVLLVFCSLLWGLSRDALRALAGELRA